MRKVKKTNRIISLMLSVLIIFTLMLLRHHFDEDYDWYWGLLSVNFSYLAFKVYTSFLYLPQQGRNQAHSISAIIPCYNEKLTSVEQVIRSLLGQSHRVDEIIFIDDGSENTECFDFVIQHSDSSTKIIAHRFEQNKGKKEAIKWGIMHAGSELILMLDSDGELNPNAIEELVKPFNDEQVGSVCGRVMVRNFKETFFTRMQEVVYFNAFEVGRASQSIFHDVIVASGALSMHRKKIFDEAALKVFDKGRFFGIRCIAGDDRLLTDIAKERNYRTIYQNTAICRTDVPTTFKKYFRQQVRWLKSAYLQSLYSIRHTWKKPLLLMYQLLESHLWLINLSVAIYVACTKEHHITPLMVIIGTIYSIIVTLFNSIKFRQYGWQMYALSVIYSCFYGFLIFIMRIYALLTIWKTGWSTR